MIDEFLEMVRNAPLVSSTAIDNIKYSTLCHNAAMWRILEEFVSDEVPGKERSKKIVKEKISSLLRCLDVAQEHRESYEHIIKTGIPLQVFASAEKDVLTEIVFVATIDLSNAWGSKYSQNTRGMSDYGELFDFGHNAMRLIPEYDCGIVIASGGLCLGSYFQLMGLPTHVVNMKRKGKSASFEPVEPLDIKNKNVLVIEDDVNSGKTLRRFVKEISKSSPKSLDLVLQFGSSLLSKLHNVPPEFGIVHPLEQSDLEHEPEIIDRLYKVVSQKYKIFKKTSNYLHYCK